MDLVIVLDENEEALLNDAARFAGLPAGDLVKRLAFDHLPVNSPPVDLDKLLGEMQQRDGTPLQADVDAATLFAAWAEEDAALSDEERKAGERLWDEIEQGLVENAGIEMRRLS